MKFWPADIKKKFPKIVQFEIIRSGLTHLEREDMRQFGDDLIQANFDGNLLTALEGDVFEFNSKLEYIGLHHNPLKFIDPQFFRNFLKLRKLNWVEIQNSDCINQDSRAPRIMNWKADECSDESAKMRNLNTISERGVFFIEIFPQLYADRIAQINELKDGLMRMMKEVRDLKCSFEKIEDSLKLLMR